MPDEKTAKKSLSFPCTREVRLFSFFGGTHLAALLENGRMGELLVKNGFEGQKDRLGKKVLRKNQVALPD
jgi:hypothetical protein